MHPENPFLQLVPGRLDALDERLRSLIWTRGPRLTCEQTRPSPNFVSLDAVHSRPMRGIGRYPHYWGKLFDQSWFRVSIPAESEHYPFLEWRDQAEATAYVNGLPWFGFDVAHRRCPLPPGVREIWIEAICLQSAIWHPDATGLDPRGSEFGGAWLVSRDATAWETYHDFRVLLDLLTFERKRNPHIPEPERSGVGYQPPIEEATVLLRRLLRSLDQAADAFDTGGLQALHRRLKGIYRELSSAPAMRAAMTGHAHIDLVWLWPERVGTAKAVHTFATVNRLLDQYPEFRFGYSQPASYRAVERRSGQLMAQVRRHIRDGRWEATGAMEVESDTLLPCGEALYRSLRLGQEGFLDLRGTPSRLLWLPDVFGYSACLPQLMLRTGVDYFFTTKLTWSSISRFPHSSFIWRGNDGSEVLAHVMQTPSGYNGAASVKEIQEGQLAYRQSDVHDEFLLPTGYGDGGGGPTEEMCERVRRVSGLGFLPAVEWSTSEAYFDRLAEKRSALPCYQGELFLEYHMGVHTTHSRLKAAYRSAEKALQTWESVRCAGSGQKIDSSIWRRLVFTQFHDCLPGSSIHEVCQAAGRELEALAEHANDQAARELSASRGKPALFNPLPYPRRLVTNVPQKEDPAIYFLPALTGAPLDECAAPPFDHPVRAGKRFLDNGILRADFDPHGRLTGLTVKGAKVAFARPSAELHLFSDHPRGHEAWDIDRWTLSLGQAANGALKPEPVQQHALRSTLAWSGPLGKASRVTVRYRLEAGSEALRIEYDIDWHEERTLLKAVFPTSYAAPLARYGQPYGSITRPQLPGSPADEAQWEVPGSRWAAVADEGEGAGFWIATEAKYGFSCREGTLGVSLLRAAAVTGEDRHYARVIPPSLRRNPPAERFSDQGRHLIRLAAGFYDSHGRRESHPSAQAEILFAPFIRYRGPARSCGAPVLHGGESLQPCWAEPLGQGRWVLRLHETLGRRGSAQLRLNSDWTAHAYDPTNGQKGNDPVQEIAFEPYEIVDLVMENRRI